MSGPHGGSFSPCRKLTQLLTNEQETRKLRSPPFFFFLVCVLIKLERACGGVQEGAVAKATRQHNESSISLLPEKKTHVRRDWLRSKYQVLHLSPDEFTSAPWALHLPVIEFVRLPPVPAHRLTRLHHSSWAPSLLKGAQRTTLTGLNMAKLNGTSQLRAALQLLKDKKMTTLDECT